MLLTLLVSFCVAATAFADGPEPVKRYGKEYFPLVAADGMRYESNLGDLEVTLRKYGPQCVHRMRNDDFTYEQRYLESDDGYYLTKTYNKIDLLVTSAESEVTYDRPVHRVKLPISAGETWTWNGTDYCDGEASRLTLVGKAIGEETVVVPAGTFTALRIRVTLDSENGSDTVVDEWYAPGVGLVKARVKMDGSGVVGTAQSVLGLDSFEYRLK
jgi:hypothetical protein